ncbi:hypothetical protein QVO32_13805 [Bacteroides gallinaceum]|uniref:Uncharacterized protein n=1 Tax=Phocaeicola intestinalis TaxID=2762212 RepID=A0ABR8Y9K7_9BACT|nr:MULTISPECIES: hypothetical protein [Bacteroidaceae]MBD8040842.1 hypothetical protein [Phocaeicola intestinalis]MBM6659734.1 hypothetical protein [Bacteroides gallinaceum]MBM6719776.1 hypothetical protein [Bacteroides gallinaceum]MDN0067446.1 hypothetical protein [Bacteroides gallinaceum]MDN0080476.1 hypothetical protein [Bacteroides gallinaceum]
MRNNILITMALLILVGLAVQGIFGIAAGILISAIIGIVYGVVKKKKLFIKWSVIALVIDLVCIIAFYLRLVQVM